MSKEEIYDEQISPLMVEIIRVCKDNEISMLCTFALPIEDDPGLACTSFVPGDKKIEAACDVVYRNAPNIPPLDIVTRDSEGNIKSVERVIG